MVQALVYSLQFTYKHTKVLSAALLLRQERWYTWKICTEAAVPPSLLSFLYSLSIT